MVEFATDHPGLMLTVYMSVNMNPDCWQMLLFQCSSALRMLKVFSLLNMSLKVIIFP